MSRPLPHLIASDFYKFVKCPNWVYWDLFGDPKDKGEVSQMMRKLREEGLLHEKEIVSKLGAFEEVAPDGTLQAQAAATLALMQKGVPIIYQGVLIDGDWVGRPDLLMRVDIEGGAARTLGGCWAYDAVDIKSARQLSDVHRYQLTFYALLLERTQGVRPERGRIINSDGEELSFPISLVYAEFFEILQKILAIRAGEKPDPFFTSACKDSPWYAACRKEAEAQDDISLIYKLYKSEYRRLKAAGYGTVAAAATSDPELFRETPGVSEHRLERIRLQAKALHEKRIIRVQDHGLGEETTELFFDIEGDPLLGVEYLFGLLVREEGEARYERFLAEKPEDEGSAWRAFCDFIEGYEGARIYHYGWYELDVIRRLSARYGISKKAGLALSLTYMVDLNKIAARSVIFPLYFYSLKDICRLLGFAWRAADASGANSVLWFQDWLRNGDRAQLQKIIDYNEDDVRATLFLKDWLVKEAKSDQ